MAQKIGRLLWTDPYIPSLSAGQVLAVKSKRPLFALKRCIAQLANFWQRRRRCMHGLPLPSHSGVKPILILQYTVLKFPKSNNEEI